MMHSLKTSLLVALITVTLSAATSQAAMIYQSNFVGPAFGAEWSNQYSANGRGTVEIRQLPDDVGRVAMSLQMRGGTAGWDVSAIDLTVNLSQHSALEMKFNHWVFQDTANTFGPLTSYTGYAPADGISISQNGVNWFPIWSPTTVSVSPIEGLWTDNETLNISAAIAAAGLSPTANFKIRFQQYSVGSNLTSDGRGYHDIRISGTPLPSPVPEPTTLGLLGIGAVCGILSSGRRRR